MKVFAIGDLHLSGQPPTKPLTIFGPHWDNHWERIQAHWREHIDPDDLVFLVGDMSWAMRLSEAKIDLDTIAALPGKKFMIRGNHDYWWTSLQKKNTLKEGRIIMASPSVARKAISIHKTLSLKKKMTATSMSGN